MALQNSFVLIKPDGIQKGLEGDVIKEIKISTKLEIVASKALQVTRELAEEFYKDMKEKPFFEELVKYIMGDYHKKAALAMVYFGENAIDKLRIEAGATDPEKASPLSIRGRHGRITTTGIYENVLHVSANPEAAGREIKLFFEPRDFIDTRFIEQLGYTISDKTFYLTPDGKIISGYVPRSSLIIAPGNRIWNSDKKILEDHLIKGKAAKSNLREATAKYKINLTTIY